MVVFALLLTQHTIKFGTCSALNCAVDAKRLTVILTGVEIKSEY